MNYFKRYTKKEQQQIQDFPSGEFAPDSAHDDLIPLVARDIKRVIVHCTASNVKKHGENLKFYLHKWHVEENKWRDIGYHYAIAPTGKIIPCRPLDRVGAHCYGYNRKSIGICLHGKNPEDFTEAQFESLRRLLKEIYADYGLSSSDVYPHNHFANKACPNFDLDSVIGYN